MPRLARYSWDPQVGVLRTARAALLTSLLMYAPMTVGSGVYERHREPQEIQRENISAQRITEISRLARSAARHMCPDVRSDRNLNFGQCALFPDRALGAADCTLQARLRRVGGS